MIKKQTALAGLASGAAFGLGIAFFSGTSFWTALQEGKLEKAVLIGLGPVAAGAVFGAFMAFVLARVESKLSIPEGETPDWFEPDEVLLRQGPSNHWRGSVNYGGWLYLSNTRLRFVPHRVLQSQEAQEWPLAAITETALVRTLLVVPSGLEIQLEGGERQRFVLRLSERSDWQNALDDARAEVQIGPPPSPAD